MPDAPDMDLVREFSRNHSEAAFTELVKRYLPLVYSVARRYTGNDGDAQDVAQAVFIIFARKAGVLRENTLLSGWLYETTRFTATRLLRTNFRRLAREQEAYMQSFLNEGNPDGNWDQLAPHLESAMARLGELDRALLVLRFYQNKTGREVAALMGIQENTLHKRAARALDKLRMILAKQGVTLSGEAVAGAISSYSIQTIPAGLVTTISAAALSKGVTASASTLTLVKGALKVMAWTKMKTAMVAGVVILVAAGTVTVTVAEIDKSNDSWRSIFHFLGRSAMEANLEKTPPQVTILPTVHPNWGAMWSGTDKKGRMLGINLPVSMLIFYSYGFLPQRMVFAAPAPAGQYDFIANLPSGSRAALQQKIQEQFGLTAHKEVRDTQVWLLTVNDAAKLKSIVNTSGHRSWKLGEGKLQIKDARISDLILQLQGLLASAPVIDHTGMSKTYDFALQWDVHDKSNRIPMITNELNAVGLELAATNMPYEMLVVEKVN